LAREVLAESVALTRSGASDAVFAQALHSLAVLHVSAGNGTAAISGLRESVAHSFGAGDMNSNVAAAGSAVLALTALGHDDAGATCVGALDAGVFADFFMLEGIPGVAEAVATLRERLGPERFDAAHARGAAAEYDEIVAYMLATFDDILTETGAGEDRGA
jgi:hypothetical protein